MDDRIERQITIHASLDRVWELVTEPGWWVPSDTAVAVDRAPGRVTVRESARYGQFPVKVLTRAPQSYAAFRWASQFPGGDLAAGTTTLVEFLVAVVADGVGVTVIESGFDALNAPDEVRRAGYHDNTEGWRLKLDELRTRAEQPSGE